MEMKSVTGALKRILRQQEPFPAMVMDRYWNVLMMNECAPRFFTCFIDVAVREGPKNTLHLLFDPKEMRPFVANWEDVAKSLFERVYRESVGRVVDEKTKALVAALLAYPDVKNEWKNPVALSFMPVIPIGFIKDGQVSN
jgi:MmyB-like transcription regulator ligand binding domain